MTQSTFLSGTQCALDPALTPNLLWLGSCRLMEDGPWDSALTHETAEPTDVSTAREVTEWGAPLFIWHGCQLGNSICSLQSLKENNLATPMPSQLSKIQNHLFLSSLHSIQTEFQAQERSTKCALVPFLSLEMPFQIFGLTWPPTQPAFQSSAASGTSSRVALWAVWLPAVSYLHPFPTVRVLLAVFFLVAGGISVSLLRVVKFQII